MSEKQYIIKTIRFSLPEEKALYDLSMSTGNFSSYIKQLLAEIVRKPQESIEQIIDRKLQERLSSSRIIVEPVTTQVSVNTQAITDILNDF